MLKSNVRSGGGGGGGTRALLALLSVGLLALCAAVFAANAPSAGAQSPSDPSGQVCPPHVPPFPALPCFDLDDRTGGTPIDDDSRNTLNEINENLRRERGGNWGLPSVAPADPGSVVSLAAPANLSVTPGEGYLDISWDAVSGATGYDVQAQTAGSSSWHDAAQVTGTSHRYTTSATIDHVRVRARDNSGVSNWAQVSRLPAADWLTTVQPAGGASASSTGGSTASLLAAPASITVTRDNMSTSRDERLTISWAAVAGADGYNLTCSGRSGWSWWECGSTDSGSVTTLTVDRAETTRLGYIVSYMVAVRAVTNNPDQASDWTISVDAHPALQPKNLAVSRSAGSISVSWTQPRYSTGYEIECATREDGVTGTYRACADVETATLGSDRRVTATLTSWTVGGTTYTVDDSKTYDLAVRTTNAWGNSPWRLAPLIHPNTSLTASNVSDDSATLTITHHTGAWYYRHTGAGATCQGPVSGTSQNITSLTGGTTHTYSAYSDSTCSTLLATATPFTTHVAVDNLDKATYQYNCPVSGNTRCAVAFTTGSNASGYTLTAITARFAATLDPNDALGDLIATIHPDESGRPDTRSTLATLTVESNPVAAGDYRFACAGNGCTLSPNTTYFVMFNATAGSSNSERYNWESTENNDENLNPTGNGWTLADGTDAQQVITWQPEYSDTGKLKITARLNPSLTSSSVTATTATLTIADHHDAWYYKATSGPHTTCQGPVAASASNASLTGLSAATSYTYSAYSDSACTNANLLATAAAFTTTLPAPTGLNLSFDSGAVKMKATWSKPSGVTGAVSYEVEHADNNTSNPYGNRTTIAATSATTVTHHFNNTLTVKFRVRAKVGNVTSAWAER